MTYSATPDAFDRAPVSIVQPPPLMARPASPEFGVIFDFVVLDQEMRQEEAYSREGHTARTLVREQDVRVVLIAMKAGSRIAKHTTRETTSIQTLAGHLRLQLPRLARQHEDRIVDLPVGRLLVLARGNEHDVEAVGDSALLVTFGWEDEEPRPDDVEAERSRIADESAKVR